MNEVFIDKEGMEEAKFQKAKEIQNSEINI